MSKHYLLIATGLALAACSSPDGPSPATSETPATATVPASARTGDHDRHDRLARRLAKALRDPSFRASVYRELQASPNPEGKIHLQGFMDRDGRVARQRLVALSGEQQADVAADLDQSAPIELYLPVAAHRRQWTGDENLLVASAESDQAAPVGYDLRGHRIALSASSPPATPVLAVNRAELSFDPGPMPLGCLVGCGGGGVGGGGGGGSGTPPSGTGLYMTQTKFNGTYEGWLKGEPEFEVHILGPASPGSTTMTTYQCAAATVGGPYSFDQNSESWTGNVLLFSQAQIDQFTQNNPGQGFRIVVVEDDDTACQIKIDSTRVTRMLDALKLVYGDLTGAKDSTNSIGKKIIGPATTYVRVLKALISFLKTNDDPVGNAVRDSAVASNFFPAANWAVRGESTTINGALRLEMK